MSIITETRSAPVPSRPELEGRILAAFRELVIAGEAAGWDINENRETLDNARNGFAELQKLFGS